MRTPHDNVTVVEVGPRDGLQNEPATIPTATKLELIHRLAASGLPVVEATSFVHPDKVPQLADAEDVMAGLQRQSAVRYPVLVPNSEGLERALSAGAREIAVFTAASEQFNQKNINCSIDESLQRFRPLVEAALQHGLWVRGYISCVLGCPYQGRVPLSAVVHVAEQLEAMGCAEISLGDTIGVGTALDAANMFKTVAHSVPMRRLAVHFHDTYGQALANILACLDVGVSVFDASVGGLGGCPFAPGATGNVATEDVIYMLDGLGLRTGVDLRVLAETGKWITSELNRPNHSRAGRALVGR